MFTKYISRKNAVILIIIIGALMAAAVIVLSVPGGGFGLSETIDASDIKGREKYLNSFGWEIDTSSEQCNEVVLPREFNGIMKDYAEMQYEQGFCLYDYAGLTCYQYTYEVTNYNYDSPVYTTLYVHNHRVIGGDIHSAAIDGFMHGIKTK